MLARIDALREKEFRRGLFNREREIAASRGSCVRMKLEPQKASITKENAAAEERRQETENKKNEVQSEVEENAEKQSKIEKTAQQQHQDPPEVEGQGQNETQAPATPGAEDAVRERRMADEFALRWSEEARAAASRSAKFMREVADEAYARIHFAEAVLCGAVLIVPLGRVGPISSYEKWWTPFKVGKQWFVLRYHDTYVREYELLTSDGPSPDDGDEPKRTRKQPRVPPKQIGPRQRRGGDDTEGKASRAAAAVRKPPRRTKKDEKNSKKKKDDPKRIAIEFCLSAGAELELRLGEARYNLRQQMRQVMRLIGPQLHDTLDRVRHAGGIALTTWRDAVAPFVQVPRQIATFANSFIAALTRPREFAIETFDTTARLESCDAGHGILSRMRLNSWLRDEPKLWPPDWFGVQYEEQAFT